MISSVLLNLIVSVVGVGLLAMAVRTAYQVAGGRLEEAPATKTMQVATPRPTSSSELHNHVSPWAPRRLVLRGAGE